MRDGEGKGRCHGAFSSDHIFILTQSIERDTRLSDEDVPTQIGRIVGLVARAMLLTSLTKNINELGRIVLISSTASKSARTKND